LVLLRQPIVAMLLERGMFTEESTSLVAWALLWYAAGLIGHALLEVIVRVFYAMYDTRTPVLVGAGAMVLNILFSLLFARWFEAAGWSPHGGLALANSLATALEAGLLLALMRRRLQGFGGRQDIQAVANMVLSGMMMVVVLLVWMSWRDRMSVSLLALAGILIGAAVYWITALVLRVGESRRIPAIFLGKRRQGA
jgi:putative peptidoglycan lipid II flippase